MGRWIKTGERTYVCSECGGKLITSYPIEQWTRCPFCRSDMVCIEEEEATDGDSESEENS